MSSLTKHRQRTSVPTSNDPAVRRGSLLGRCAARLRDWIGKGGQARIAECVSVEPFWDPAVAFALALGAARSGEYDLAEHELTRGGGDRAVSDAHCLNLLGVIHERRQHWSRAKRCYSRAARRDRNLAAPRANLRRYYELCTFGRTRISIQWGDEETSTS
ncbi:MAG: hypothetical protein ACTHLN_13510 [Tepidisphaeraceae bacterium]